MCNVFVHSRFLHWIISWRLRFKLCWEIILVGWSGYLVGEDSIGGEICEVTGGVGGVTLHQCAPPATPGLGLDIPVNTTLKLEMKIFLKL